jgi:glutamate---cysteine ligase / carboxylate-amine ligase
VELRICDGIPTMSEIAAIAALTQSLVEWMDSLLDRGYSLPTPRSWVVRENKWRAARHGVHADIIVGDSGDNVVPLCTALHELIEELSPVAERLDCIKELRHCMTILEQGPSYLRQRAIVADGGSLSDVVDSLIREMETDEPTGA